MKIEDWIKKAIPFLEFEANLISDRFACRSEKDLNPYCEFERMALEVEKENLEILYELLETYHDGRIEFK